MPQAASRICVTRPFHSSRMKSSRRVAPATIAVQAAGVSAPLLLATRYTMEEDFYTNRLATHGVQAVIPELAERMTVHNIIYDELCQGVVSPRSKQRFLEVVAAARGRGADGVIFGCTEIGLLLSADDFDIPTFDTTALHAQAALEFALGV